MFTLLQYAFLFCVYYTPHVTFDNLTDLLCEPLWTLMCTTLNSETLSESQMEHRMLSASWALFLSTWATVPLKSLNRASPPPLPSLYFPTARKSKKLGKLKSVSEDSPLQNSKDGGHYLPSEKELSAVTELVPHGPAVASYLSPSVCSVLELIEPEEVYAGYDNTQPDTSDHLLTSLNRLAGKQMVRMVKWAKVLPGITNRKYFPTLRSWAALHPYPYLPLILPALELGLNQDFKEVQFLFQEQQTLTSLVNKRSIVPSKCAHIQRIKNFTHFRCSVHFLCC